MTDILNGKTIIWDGDSICAGNKVKGNWATRIADRCSMQYKNYAIGGGTIAEGYPDTKSGGKRHSVSKTLERMHDEYPSADYIIIEGGTNDADLHRRMINEGEEDRIGEIDPNYFGPDFDVTTFCGGLESVFFRAINYWTGKKIGFIIAHKMGPSIEEYNIRRPYFDKCVEICKKWGIPYLDLWNGCYLNPFNSAMYDRSLTPEENNEKNTGFYSDGQHLTAKGYDFTSDIVETWLRSL